MRCRAKQHVNRCASISYYLKSLILLFILSVLLLYCIFMLHTRIEPSIPRSLSSMCHVLRCTTMTRYSGLQNNSNVLVYNSVFLLVLLSQFSFVNRLLRNTDSVSVKCLCDIFEAAGTSYGPPCWYCLRQQIKMYVVRVASGGILFRLHYGNL